MMKLNLLKAPVIIGLFSLSATAFAAGPVTHSAARDQKQSGFCWSYSAAGLMEGEALKRGIQVHLSPEYLGFYHIFSELKTHLSTYKRLAAVNVGALHGVAQSIVKDILHPQSGNVMKVALQELAQYGTVPESVFETKILEGRGDTPFDDKLTTFAETQLLDKAKLAQYIANSDSLLSDLSSVFGKELPRTSDSFEYEGKSYTPQTFLSDYLNFDPNDYVEVTVRSYNHDAAMAAIEQALGDNIQVPIGFTVMNDQVEAEKTGIFDPSNCNGTCHSGGGHEVLIIGSKQDSDGSTSGLIVKNSWGDMGLNDLGESTDDDDSLGYFIIQNNYLQLDEGVLGWSFVVPKSYAPQVVPAQASGKWAKIKKIFGFGR